MTSKRVEGINMHSLTLDESFLSFIQNGVFVTYDRDFSAKLPKIPQCLAYARKNNSIFVCTKYGYIINDNLFELERLGLDANDECKEVDFVNETFAITFTETIKIFRIGANPTAFNCAYNLPWEYSGTTISKDAGAVLGIMRNDDDLSAIYTLDLENGYNQRLTAEEGVVSRFRDFKVKDENTFYAINEDKTLRTYDKRVGTDPQAISRSTSGDLYKLDHDGLNTVLCACKQAEVLLFDIRFPGPAIQCYMVDENQPHYLSDLACDTQTAFVATLQGLYELNF